MGIGLTVFMTLAGVNSLQGLPKSLREGELAACEATTLEAAESCLINALSKDDLSKLLDEKLGAFRGALDCVIEIEWRLGNPSSPMAKVMREKLATDNPAIAAGTIIQDVQLRAAGSAIDWNRAQQAASSLPPDAHRTTCPQSIEPERGNAD